MRNIPIVLTLFTLGPGLSAQALLDRAILERHLPAVPTSTRAVALVDVDGDRALDLVVGAQGRDRLLIGDGHGRFGESTRPWPAEDDVTSAVAAADLDGDGDQDLVIGRSGALDRLLLGDGTGAFVEAPGALPGTTGETSQLVLEDLDGDGDIDVFAAGSTCHLFRNDGSGVFIDVTASALPSDARSIAAAIAIDVDRDGHLDLLSGGRAAHSVRLWVNRGDGTFQDDSAARLPTGLDRASALGVGDLDGDGSAEVLLGTPDGAPTLLLIPDGAGGLQLAPTGRIPGVSGDVRQVSCVDLDGDGDLDALLAGGLATAAERVHAWRNDAGQLVDATDDWVGRMSSVVMGLAIGDVDGDRAPDVVVGVLGSMSPELDVLLLNDGSGRMVAACATALPPSLGSTRAMVRSDLDGDGAPDLVFGDSPFTSSPIPPQSLTAFRSAGAEGRFAGFGSQMLPPHNDRIAALACADLDGDGAVDLLVGGPDTADRVLIQRGDGRFVDETGARMPGAVARTTAFAVADVDADGDLDIAVGKGDSFHPDLVVLWQNDGTGHFVDASADLPGVAVATSVLCFADFDGDRDLDLFVGNGFPLPGDQRDELWLNDGRGRFAAVTATNLPTDAGATLTVRPADFDGDGDLDLYCGAWTGHRLLQNDGLGRFATVTGLPVLTETVACVEVADLDGDGAADLIAGLGAGSSSTQRLVAFGGLGAARFEDRTAAWLPPWTEGVAALIATDLDEDGDADLVLAARGSLFGAANAVLTNRTRHVTTPWLPRTGGDLALEIGAWTGRPGTFQVALPLLAAQRTAIDLPPFGRLGIDLVGAIALNPVYLPPWAGFATCSVPVPADPALVGGAVFTQALFVSPLGVARFGPVTADVIR